MEEMISGYWKQLTRLTFKITGSTLDYSFGVCGGRTRHFYSSQKPGVCTIDLFFQLIVERFDSHSVLWFTWQVNVPSPGPTHAMWGELGTMLWYKSVGSVPDIVVRGDDHTPNVQCTRVNAMFSHPVQYRRKYATAHVCREHRVKDVSGSAMISLS